ncbi:MATE family efflux transporter [Peptoclostridium sp.]|uniref:MATE family efflux transporter n=1 Tax=Peptoclostridium sp. TaxID=1904860 RepID=UPI0025DF0B08|nr:MATE family efflux transporter [Peptoclostridium sp.]
MIASFAEKMQILMIDKEFYKTMLKISIPIIIQSFVASSLNMIDTIMIGRLGETPLAAVGIANQYFFLFNLTVIGICSGCGVFISQFWGKKDIRNIRRTHGLSLLFVTMAAVLFTLPALIIPDKIITVFNIDSSVIELGAKYLLIVVVSYIFTGITFAYSFSLRSTENAIPPMIVSTVALLLNTVLNYGLIFGNLGLPQLGVAGAAIATVIARLAESIFIVAYVYAKNGPLAGRLGELVDIDSKFMGKVIHIIMNVVLNEACWGFGFVAYSVVYGRIGTQAIAAVQICNTIQNIFMVVIFGMASASAVMIGNCIGAGEEEKARNNAYRFTALGTAVGLIIAVLLALAAPFIVSFFNVSGSVARDSLWMLYITAGSLIVRVFNIIMIVGVLRGGGDTKFSLLTEAFTMWFIGVTTAVIGAFLLRLPVYWVYALVILEEIVKFAIVLYRLISNRWVKNIVHNI